MSEVLCNHPDVSNKAAHPDTTLIDGPDHNKNYLFTGGGAGNFLVRDTGSTTGAQWSDAVQALAIGGAQSLASQLHITGSFTSNQNDANAVNIATTIAATTDSGILQGLRVAPTFVERSGGTHPLFASISVQAATVTGGVATVTNTASLYIAGSMTATVTDENYAIWSAAGKNRFDGQVSIGSATESNVQFLLKGTFTSPTSSAVGMRLRPTLAVTLDSGDMAGLQVSPTFTETGGGAHPLFASIWIETGIVTSGAALVTNTASLYIAGAMSATVAGANYSIWVDAGKSRFDDDIQVTAIAPQAGSSFTVRGSMVPDTDAGFNLASSSFRWNNAYVASFVRLGSAIDNADAGVFRTTNTSVIAWRNAAGSGNVGLAVSTLDKWNFDAGSVYGGGLILGTSATNGIDLDGSTFSLRSATRIQINKSGPHAIGGAIDDSVGLYLRGTFTREISVLLAQTLTPQANADSSQLAVGGAFTEAGSGTHALFATARFDASTVNAAAGAVTNTATVYVSGPMTATVTADNWALWVASGNSKFGGNVDASQFAASQFVAGPLPSATTGQFRTGHSGAWYARNSGASIDRHVASFGLVGTDEAAFGDAATATVIQGTTRFTTVGPHAIGGATATDKQLRLTGTFAPAGDHARGFAIDSSLTPGVNREASALYLVPTFIEAASGTHALLATANIGVATVTPGVATVTDTASLYVEGPMTATVTGKNYAAYIGGPTRINGNIHFFGISSVQPMLKPASSDPRLDLRTSDDSDWSDFYVGSVVAATSLRAGTNPATTGAVRLANNGAAYWRNAANNANLRGLAIENDVLYLGDTNTNIIVERVGPHAIGGATNAAVQVYVRGTFAGDGSEVIGIGVASSLGGTSGQNMYGIKSAPTFVEASSGTHGLLASIAAIAATVTGGAAAVTNTATLYVSGSMTATVTGENYALWVDEGTSRFDGTVLANAVRAQAGAAFIFGGNDSNHWTVLTTGNLEPVVDANNQIGTSTKRVYAFVGSEYLAIGTNPAGAGGIRLPSGSTGRIAYRNAANSADIVAFESTAANVLELGTGYTSTKIAGVGPHALGVSVDSTVQFKVGGTFAERIGFELGTTIQPPAGASGFGFNIGPAFTEAASGNHPRLATVSIGIAPVTGGAATVTDTASLYVEGQMAATVTGRNYAVWVDSGDVRVDGVILTEGLRGFQEVSNVLRFDMGANYYSGYHFLTAATTGLYVVSDKVAIGGTTTSSTQVWIQGTPVFTTDAFGVRITSTLNTPTDGRGRALLVDPTFGEAPSGTHPLFASIYVAAATVNGSGAAVTDTASVYISGAISATVTGANYAIWSAAGKNRFDGQVSFGAAPNTFWQVLVAGSFSPSASGGGALSVQPSITGPVGGDVYGLSLSPTFVEAASGNHPLIANLIVGQATVTGGAATVTDTASLFITGAMTATVSGENYAIWSSAGKNRFDGQVSFGAAPNADRYVRVAGSFAGVASPIGLGLEPTLTPAAGGESYNVYFYPVFTEAGSGNHPKLVNAYIDTAVVNAAAATVTDTVSLYVAGAMSATVSGQNYAVWVDSGKVRIDDSLTIGGAPIPSAQFYVLGAYTSGAANAYAGLIETSINVSAANGEMYGFRVEPTFVEYSSGTHPLLASVRISAATVTGGAAAVTNTASLYIAGAMSATVTGENYAIWSAGGKTRLDGPVSVGGASDNRHYVQLIGTYSPTGGDGAAFAVTPTINGAAGEIVTGLHLSPTFVEAGSGTHSLIATQRIAAATVTGGAATVTNTASLYIAGAMSATVTGGNYALFIEAGVFRSNGSIYLQHDGAGLLLGASLDAAVVRGGAGIVRLANGALTNYCDFDVSGDANMNIAPEAAALNAAATRQTIGASNSVSGLLVIEDGTAGRAGVFLLDAAAGTATEISDPASVFGTAAGASDVNIYASGGQWTIQNNTAGAKTIRTLVLR